MTVLEYDTWSYNTKFSIHNYADLGYPDQSFSKRGKMEDSKNAIRQDK